MTTYPNAIANAKALKHAYPVGSCLMAVRIAFGLDANGHEPNAAAAWTYEGGHDGPNTHYQIAPPANVPVFWTGGSHGYGHVAISDGKGNVYSTDVKRTGLFDLVPISEIHTKWGLKFVGWTETLEGHRIHAHVVA